MNRARIFPRRTDARALWIVLTLLALVSASSCSFFQPSQPKPKTTYVENVSLLKGISRLASAHYATTFWWWDSAGNERRLDNYYGNVILLHFWNSKVPGALEEEKTLDSIATQFADSGIVQIGIPLREASQPGEAALQPILKLVTENGLWHQQVIGNSELSYAYEGIEALPTTVVISRQGRVVATLVGKQLRSTLEEQVRKALASVEK